MTEVGGESGQRPPERDGRTAVLVVVGTFGLQALTMVTGVVTARILGVEGRGVVALVFALSLMASQLTLGGSLPTALAKNLAERHVGARDGLRVIARRRGWLLLLPCVAAAAVMLWLHRDDGDPVALGAVVLVMTLQTILSRLLISSLQGEVGALVRMVVVAIVPQALFTVSLSVVAVAGWRWSALEVLVSFLVASTIGLVVGLRALAPPTGRAEDALDERRLWTDTRATYVSSVRPLDSIGLDRILVGALISNAALGLYAAAIAVANLCGTVGNAVSVIVLPQVARAHADPAAQRAVARRWLGLTALVVLVIVAGLQLVIDPLIRIAFGEEFAGATETARWLIVADAFFGLRKVLIAVLQGQGRGGTASWIELLLAPLLVLGVVVASQVGELPVVGMTMVGVAALACVALGVAVRRPVPPDVRPPSTTTT